QQPCTPVNDLLGCADISLAYAVQQAVTELRVATGAHVVGRKIGLTAPTVQHQLGVDQPDFGTLFDDMRCDTERPISLTRLIQPKIEAEIAFVLEADIDATEPTRNNVGAAVDYAVPALEIVDSRIRDWQISITDTIADNASSGLFVLGTDRLSLDRFEPAATTMTLRLDGSVVSRGNGQACLGDPLNALAWLARTAQQLQSPLRAGDIVLSGALGPMAAVQSDGVWTADITPLGSVSATFTSTEEHRQ
ncbi:MAG: 2-keto-4-pentenoate hydratase, partial [Mycobacterium sp.]